MVTNAGKNLLYFLNPAHSDNVLHYETPSMSGVTAAYEWNKDRTTSGNGTASGVSNLTVTGPNSTFILKKFTGYTVGAEVPVGTATVLGVNYTAMNYKGTLNESTNLGKVALSARYALSKTTFLYAGASFATGQLKDYISQKTVVQAGLRTSF